MTARLLTGCAALALLLAGTTGCVVAPPYPYYSDPAYVGAPVYSTVPTYVSPGIGFSWVQHPRYGYGWYNPSRGWHRGWSGGGGGWGHRGGGGGGWGGHRGR